MSNTRKLGCRGDSRHPYKNKIFQKGFFARTNGSIDYQFDHGTDQATAVCFTWNISMAAYFPLEATQSKTWIYLLNIDLSSAATDDIFHSKIEAVKKNQSDIDTLSSTTNHFVNIHGRQVLDSIKGYGKPECHFIFLSSKEQDVTVDVLRKLKIESGSAYVFTGEKFFCIAKNMPSNNYVFINLTKPQIEKLIIFTKNLNLDKDKKAVLSTEQLKEITSITNHRWFDPSIYAYLYANEAAIKYVLPQDILYAVECVRTWNNSEEWQDGGTYQLTGEVLKNPNAKFESAGKMATMACSILEAMVKGKESFKMPLPKDGYQLRDSASLVESKQEEKKSNYNPKIFKKAETFRVENENDTVVVLKNKFVG